MNIYYSKITKYNTEKSFDVKKCTKIHQTNHKTKELLELFRAVCCLWFLPLELFRIGICSKDLILIDFLPNEKMPILRKHSFFIV